MVEILSYLGHMWKDLYLSAIDQTVPKLKWHRRKVKHWFSHDTISLIHKKRKLYKAMKLSASPNDIAKYHYIKLSCNLVRSKTVFVLQLRNFGSG